MAYENAYEKEKEVVINGFRRKFFQRFGNHIDIFIRPNVLAVDQRLQTDSDRNFVRKILNEKIPFHLLQLYPDILHRTRKREIVELRMIYMKILRDQGVKLKEIGELCGTDHTTVIHAVQTINDLLSVDGDFENYYHNLVQEIQEKLNQQNARTDEPADKEQSDSQSANVITLYPREHTAREYDSFPLSRGIDLPHPGMDQYRKSASTQSIAATV